VRLARRGLVLWSCATFVLVPGAAAAHVDLLRGAGAKPVPATTVHVSMRDFRFSLSRTHVATGRIRFVVRNAGKLAHDFAIAGKHTRRLGPGRSQTIAVTIRKSGRFAYRCTIPGHAAVGMKGVLAVGKAMTPKPPPPPPPPSTAPLVAPTKIGDFTDPVDVVAPPGDARRLLVVNKSGLVQELLDGRLQTQPFLDLSKFVQSDIENGMLKLVFAPDYATSGRLYVYFNDRVGNKNANLVEFRRSAVDPDTADPGTWRQILSIVKPWTNHNGGMLEFGPDAYLYVSVGDGDSGVLHKPGAFAQTRDDLLGDILRIDPLHGDPYTVPATNPFVGIPGVRPEIWAYGLRNPWRFWIDPPTGDLYIGDVGLWTQEEVDYVPGGAGGQNFGWPCFEGSAPFDATESCPGAVAPAYSYDRAGGRCGVIGGVVAHDQRLPALAGKFLFADLCSGQLTSLTMHDGTATVAPLNVAIDFPESFGVDALGQIYVAGRGAVYRLDPPQS
jgi:glucose/arabinose dehydrogenase